MILRKQLRNIRLNNNKSLKEFAKELDISVKYLSDIELGRKYPSEDLLRKIAYLLKNKKMNIEQINETITNYDKLCNLVKSKIELIEKLDKKYSTSKGIDRINFNKEDVLVTCGGYFDHSYFAFPTIWLTKTDAEVEEIVITAKKLKEEKERIAKEEAQLKENKEKEKREHEQYLRLKTKFDKNKT